MSELDSVDRREATTGLPVPEAKVERLTEKIEALKQEVERLKAIETEIEKSDDSQVSLTDPDARSMATTSRHPRVVGYNVQSAVDTKRHLIVAHEVTNIGAWIPPAFAANLSHSEETDGTPSRRHSRRRYGGL